MNTTDFEKEANGYLVKKDMVETHDGLKLYLVRNCTSVEPKALLIILHGLANHSGLYDGFVPAFLERGISVYRYDARGHGKSEGKRGYLNSYWEMAEDLRVIVELVKSENPGVPVFVLGHSMGGHVSALYGTKYPNQVRGIILAAGVLRYNFMNFGWLPRPEQPDEYINTIDAAYGTLHLPEWKSMKMFSAEGDTNSLSEVSAAILNAFAETIQYLKDNCRTFTNSVLILNGNHDTSVSPQDAIDFYQQTGAKDKSLRIYAGVNHFLMNDPKGHQIAPDVISWIEDRLGDETYEDFGN